MKMKAKDSFHTSGVGMVHAGTEFEVHDALGQEIADKGLATVVEASTDTSAGAAETERKAPKTRQKAEPPLANKAIPPISNKTFE